MTQVKLNFKSKIPISIELNIETIVSYIQKYDFKSSKFG